LAKCIKRWLMRQVVDHSLKLCNLLQKIENLSLKWIAYKLKKWKLL
jgi:hypothetical protein